MICLFLRWLCTIVRAWDLLTERLVYSVLILFGYYTHYVLENDDSILFSTSAEDITTNVEVCFLKDLQTIQSLLRFHEMIIYC